MYIKTCDECWCGSSNRYDKSHGKSLDDCKSICNADENCKGIEYWAGDSWLSNRSCFKCSNLDQTSTNNDSWDPSFPPSVYKKDTGSP